VTLGSQTQVPTQAAIIPAGSPDRVTRAKIPYSEKKIEAPPLRPMTQKIQPTAFPDGREAMMAPTVGNAIAITTSTPNDSFNTWTKEPFRYRNNTPNTANATLNAQRDHASTAARRPLIRSSFALVGSC
jgi:hypothetical protein